MDRQLGVNSNKCSVPDRIGHRQNWFLFLQELSADTVRGKMTADPGKTHAGPKSVSTVEKHEELVLCTEGEKHNDNLGERLKSTSANHLTWYISTTANSSGFTSGRLLSARATPAQPYHTNIWPEFFFIGLKTSFPSNSHCLICYLFNLRKNSYMIHNVIQFLNYFSTYSKFLQYFSNY